VSWGIGRFERIAPTLLPASELAVARIDVRPGERVLDLGCGSGNATELLARTGAEVTAVDPAPRLLDVARQRLSDAGLSAAFAQGVAGDIPLADASVDAVVSVFAMVFAPDPDRVVAEVARVLRRPGRLVFTAWLPEGAMFEVSRDRRLAIEEVTGSSVAATLAWHDLAQVTDAFAPYGFEVRSEEHELAFTGDSPDQYVDVELAEHPMWVLARSILEPRGEWEELRERSRASFRSANEDPAAFRVTSRYVVVTATRAG
jgi:SAM-dependent methyltransferase